MEIIFNYTRRIKLVFHRHECELHYVPAICVAYDDASAWRAVTLALYAHFVIWVWAFFWTNWLLHLFELLSNYVGSNENKSFSRLNLHAIFYVLVELMPKVTSISYVTWSSCIISFCKPFFFCPNNWFSMTFTKYVGERMAATIRPLFDWDTIFKWLQTTQITFKWQKILKMVMVKNVKLSNVNVR